MVITIKKEKEQFKKIADKERKRKKEKFKIVTKSVAIEPIME